ncbi:MAG: hypothetical protein ACK4R6_06765 [Spirosomataceae bacterium]
MAEQQNDSDFQYGIHNGLERIDKDNYEVYISSAESSEIIEKKLTRKYAQLEELDEKIRNYAVQLQHYFSEKTNAGAQEEVQKVVQKQVSDELDKLINKQQKIEAKKEYLYSKHSLFAALLYVIGGFIFLAGDLIISHEIVAYALNIKGTFEAWSFAVGLAMISILLKPAYEQLIERPYLHSKQTSSRVLYAVFHGLLVVFAVSTLTILGWFRYEAYKTDQLRLNITKEIRRIQRDIDVLEPTDLLLKNQLEKQVENLITQANNLTVNLVNNDWALLSFVLSGVLFALAGAVCLGIGLSALHYYWFKWLQANRSQRKLNKQTIPLKEQIIEVEKQINALQAIQKQLAFTLETTPSEEDLKKNRDEVLEEINELEGKYLRAKENTRISLYTDGYQKGQTIRNNMTTEEWKTHQKGERLEEQSVNDVTKSYKKAGARPYIALRKEINSSFNKN